MEHQVGDAMTELSASYQRGSRDCSSGHHRRAEAVGPARVIQGKGRGASQEEKAENRLCALGVLRALKQCQGVGMAEPSEASPLERMSVCS